MEDYLSEREQIEKVRGWFKENAPWAVAGLVIGAGAILGYKQFQGWHERQALVASQKYSATLAALARADHDAATRLVTELRADYGRTPYADLAELGLARFEVESNQLGDAARDLEGVIQASRDPELKVVARLRLARVQRADHKPDLALATLATMPAGPAVADVRGDALADKGDQAGALAAWREALAAKSPTGIDRALVELKITALEAAPAASKPAAVAPTAPAGGRP